MYKRLILLPVFAFFSFFAHSQVRNLEFYLSEGLKNSPLLNDYRNRMAASTTDSLLVRASKKPYVEARSMLQYSPRYGNFGYDEVITDGGNYSAVMGVTQPIFNRRELANKYEAIALQKKLTENSSKISEIELKRVITDQYLITFSGYNDCQFNSSFLELFHNENEIVKEFIKNGVYNQTDYLTLLVETQSQEILVNQLKSQYRKNLILLNQLCGMDDTAHYELATPQVMLNGVPDIENTPSFLQYKIDSIRIENEKLAIDIRYQPKANWFADAGILTHDPVNFYKHIGYSAGISLNIPVYDGKQRELEKRKLEFNENSRQNYQSNYRIQYYQQLQQLNEELKSLNDMDISINNQLQTSDKLVKALKIQLESGNIQMTDYINAIKNFKTINRNLNLINIQKMQVINEINFLLTQ